MDPEEAPLNQGDPPSPWGFFLHYSSSARGNSERGLALAGVHHGADPFRPSWTLISPGTVRKTVVELSFAHFYCRFVRERTRALFVLSLP